MDTQAPEASPEHGARETDAASRALLLSTAVFSRIEHAAYIAVGALLSVTAALALGGAVVALWSGLNDWSGSNTIGAVIERLLFVLMLVEILHTVRASIRSGGLSAEPFLIVGLIACIRRVLVSTLESTEATRAAASSANASDSELAFRASMIELGVLGFLILVMVVSIYMLRRAKATAEPD